MILDLFAGPGGWSEGLRNIGLEDVGIEWDDAACATRAAAGHTTIRADVSQYPTAPFVGKVSGLIASPPCQDFSEAGNGAGLDGATGRHVTEVMRWADDLMPEWIACEQVPPVLPIWDDYAQTLEGWGYSTWSGILNAANYGVPQTRRRAILLASRIGPALPPEPTHAKNPEPGLFGTLEPWVSMANALGWDPTTTGINTGRDWKPGGSRETAQVIPGSAPAPTVSAIAGGQWIVTGPDMPPKLTVSEALMLQSFPATYPLAGTKTRQFEQVGNAIPPTLAAAIVANLIR